LGVAYMNQQRMDRAVEEFDQALKADPGLTAAELNKGIALLNLQKLSEAEEALNTAAAKEPSNPRVWYNLGLLRRSQGKSAEAIDAFQRVLKIDRNDPDTHYFLGTMYSQQQQYDKAIAEFEAALRLQPLYASAQFGLARAFQRSGNADAAREHLQTFEHLTKTNLSAPITLSYGEQGRYSAAQEVITQEPKVGPMIPVTFVAQPIGRATASSPAATSGKAGGGICMLDVAGGGRFDLVVMGDGEHAIRVYHDVENGKWSELPPQQTGLDASGTGISCAVGDFDSDGRNDLAVALSDRVLLFRNLGGGKFTDVTKSAGILPVNRPAGLTFVDFDHDGDLDLFVTGQPGGGQPASSNVLWRNNGNEKFTNWTAETGLGGEGATTSVVLSDINNDRAVDLLVTGSGGAPTLYLNPREGHFKALPLYDVAGPPPTVGVYVFDFNKDGWMDIAVTHAGAPGVSLWRNVEGKRFERVPLPISDATRGWGVTAIDFDNDGWIDLAVVVETARGPELRVLRNTGEQGFEDVSAKLGLDKVKLLEPRSVIAADVDGDNDSDLVVSQLGADPVILRNDGGNRNHALRINFKGLADNKTGLGTKVEVFAGTLWQKWEVVGGAGYLSQGPPEILAGLGSVDHADIVRMLWPTGVLQDEIAVAANQPVTFTEIDRRGSSCPTLFVWNGEKYEFISDVIGAAVIGHWISPTAKNTADPDEWIKIEGSQLKARDGYFSVRFGEPMEEVNFIDQLRLIAVDHPDGTDVFPDERFLDDPPFASGAPVLTSAPHPPLGAWDDKGRDVLALLSARDHKYVRDFTNLSFAGFANMHSLTLDVGAWTPQNPLLLFLHGFIEYFSATSMYAAWQAGLQPVSPYIEAQMPDGTWKRVVDDMGLPAGLPRTITVDLTGKLPPQARRIRITTNLQIYWDQVLLDNGPQQSNRIRTTELPLASATLGFRGYPRQVDGATPGDLTYYYDQASTTGPFSQFRGSYTRYGDVTALLTQIDDRFVIFGTGEDIDAEFSAASLPPAAPGWTRDYFFYANGFVKDMDFYEATPFTVAEMPFHAMKAYPYPAGQHYPNDSGATAYRLDWNDRSQRGSTNARGYTFQYGSRTIDPEPLTPGRARQAATEATKPRN
ncbi:MAG TPA: FG-GAP-like repeat-containing protein, partial [Terriglobales bacterium]|nr:FG-GAP-like repeat-containing protein [Terriglobales bacterium]